MKKYLFVLLASGVALSAGAQIGGLVNQVENNQTRTELNRSAAELAGSNSVPELYEGESSDIGPQSVVQPVARRTYIRASADEQFYYTDNVLLSQARNKISTGVLLSTGEFAIAPTQLTLGSGTLLPEVGYRGQWFDFGLDGKKIPFSSLHLRDLDFNAQTIYGNVSWIYQNWTVGMDMEATRLFSTGDYHAFYDELVPNWMARRVFPICKRTAFAASYEGDYHATHITRQFLEFGSDDASDRTDHSLLLTFTQVLCRQVIFEPYYQLQFTHYMHYPLGPRNDYLNTMGAGLYWIVCPNFSIRTFASYDILKSGNDRIPDYHKLDAGGGINLTVRF